MTAGTPRTAFITGAGNGMGRAHALTLAAAGYTVCATDIDESAVTSVADAASGLDGRVVARKLDVTDRAEVEAVAEGFAQLAGGIDVLVSNAGLIHTNETLADTDDDTWHRTFAVHVDGALNTSRACLPWLKESGSGRIIIISSIWGQAGIGHSYAYCAAKGALMAFAKNAAKELGQYGISVNAVAPGGVHTAMTAEFSQAELEDDYRTVPLGRYADPEEISYLIEYLAGPRSAFLTGQTISINGGQVIGGF
ncbi:SDR family NAD(P)-dependent oxidoreductase [Mycobacterium sp. GA-2829]|uniref:SDR family NAD(P)-dependent oxidoreductase n=1 Tax=Mycobacterium sp. GA-2829 TaxID=1772283 RepID=UPI00073FEA9C|nr:SDR family NAD(P)-dependent oxidoreductase [Mycobacterium sp. GA-2829]KUI33248.1 hypothetical protein AU194_19760 [Mycobacterium sp. GA-2829]